MAISHTVTRTYKDRAAASISKVETVTSNFEKSISLLLSASANQLVAFTITRADLKSLVISCDVAITVYTNAASTGAPTDTIAIAAGQALVWSLGMDGLARCPFTANVTALYVTAAAVGTLELRALHA